MLQVGVAAYGSEPSENLKCLAREFVRELSKRFERVTLVLGGDWGLMGTVVEEALKFENLNVVLVMPERRSSRFERVVCIRTGLSPNARSTILVNSSDVLVALGGGAGTIMETLMAYREGKPVVAIVGYGADSDWFFKSMGKYPDSRGLAPYYIVSNACEAVNIIAKIVENGHHHV